MIKITLYSCGCHEFYASIKFKLNKYPVNTKYRECTSISNEPFKINYITDK